MQPSILGVVPPWTLVAAVVGLMHGALFHLFFGSRVRQLPIELLVALVSAILGALLGTMIPPAIIAIGDTNLIATTAAAWLALGIARLLRFC